MDKIIKNKKGLELVTNCSSGYETNSENSFVNYELSDHIWWYNKIKFLSYSKNYTCKLMQANSWHHKLFHCHMSFWIWKVWKGREKITKIWIPWEWKELFWWNKKHFLYFWRSFIWWKNKNLIKNSGHKL